LGEHISQAINDHLSAQIIAMRQEKIIDATLIASPRSTYLMPKLVCVGGKRPKKESAIRRSMRQRRATSDIFERKFTSVTTGTLD
jgi:hypothetical protein